MGISIYIDDARKKPKGYSVKTDSLGYFLKLLLQQNVEKVSFDHDLDDYKLDGYDFAHVATLLAKEGFIDKFEWEIHSANPVGTNRIRHELEKADKAWNEMEDDKSE